MSDNAAARIHTPSAIVGALLALAGIAVGALLTTGSGVPQALASSPEVGDSIPAIELDQGTTALVVDRRGLFFMVDDKARAFPVRYDETALRNVPGEEILQAR